MRILAWTWLGTLCLILGVVLAIVAVNNLTAVLVCLGGTLVAVLTALAINEVID